MKTLHLGFLLTLFYLLTTTTNAQRVSNGRYYGQWANKVISATVSNDTLTIKKGKTMDDTVIIVTPVKSVDSVVMDRREYSISFVIDKTPNSLLLQSYSDTIELIKISEKTKEGKVIWETTVKRTYADNGQPSDYSISYYDTSKTDVYPNRPYLMTSFVNDRDQNNYFLKHGPEYEYYPYGSYLAKEKRKWKKGILIKTTFY